MVAPGHRISPRHVVVVGAGVAGLELVLALHDLAEGQLQVTMITPETQVRLPALEVARPFDRGDLAPLALAEVLAAHGGEVVHDRVVALDPGAHVVTTHHGGDVGYDVLVVAVGAQAQPAFDHVVTVGEDDEALGTLLDDLRHGRSRSVAFVVPRGCSWPLPAYELALMTAAELAGAPQVHQEIHLVTPELRPLALFGPEAGTAVAALLADARVHFHGAVSPRVPRPGCVDTGFDEDLLVDHVVALAALSGPQLAGLPVTASGWVPVDDQGRVRGLDDVYAVGDATDRPVKQGGLACQQADIAAAAIARDAGAGVEVPDVPPVLRARLLNGRRDRFLERVEGVRTGLIADEPLWWPPEKVSGRYLGPYLKARGIVDLPLREGHRGAPLDVRVPLRWAAEADDDLFR